MNVQIAAQLQRGNALGTVHKDHDRGEQVGEGKLARGEDRAAGDAELMMASDALEAASARNVISLDTTTTRANCFAVRVGPTKAAERLISLVLTRLIDGLEAQRAGGRRE